MCIFKAYVPKSTLLDIVNPALTSRKHLLKIHFILPKETSRIVHAWWIIYLMFTFKAYVLESTLLNILNHALTSRKHILKVSGHSTKGGL